MIAIYEGYITNKNKARGFFSMTKAGLLEMIKDEDFIKIDVRRVKNG